MIGYITIGTNKFDDAAAFYDGLFAEMGIGRSLQFVPPQQWGTCDRRQWINDCTQR